MPPRNWKTKIEQALFSNSAAKFVWYKLRRAISSRRSSIAGPVDTPRKMTWGTDVSLNRNLAPLPKIIWTYWEGRPSACAIGCQKSWRSNNNGFEIHQLTAESIKSYLPDFPKIPRGVPVQLTSDLLRLMLLERFGGIWMDYTIVATQSLDWVTDIFKADDCELLAFYNEFPSHYRSDPDRPIIENGFLASRPGSGFVSEWRRLFQDCILSGRYKGYYRRDPNYKMLVSNFLIEDQAFIDYLACYVAAQMVMLNSKNYRLSLINAEDDFYHYYFRTKPIRVRRKFSEELLLHIPEGQPASKLIKINGWQRTSIDEHIKYGCYRKGSVLGRFM